MAEGILTIAELMPLRDELLTGIQDMSATPKNELLTIMADDPLYHPAIEAHGLLKKMAKTLAHAAGVQFPSSPSPEVPNVSFEHWLDQTVFDAIRNGGNHIIEFGQYIDLDERVRHESVHSILTYGAHKAAERSEHDRFFVGAMGFYTDETRTRVGIFSTANSKEHELAPKYCAELKNLEIADKHGLKVCIALYVSGDTQEDDDSGKTPETLHPCRNCREELATNPLVSSNTLVVCAGRNQKIEMFTPHQLLRYHHEL